MSLVWSGLVPGALQCLRTHPDALGTSSRAVYQIDDIWHPEEKASDFWRRARVDACSGRRLGSARSDRHREESLSPEIFRFLHQLKRHNDRQWFERNKKRYLKEVREPLLAFVESFGPRLEKISPHVVADPRPVGGSVFRIHRDLRFSKDKRPYKTHAGIYFNHALGKQLDAPGFYLHLEPGNCFFASGLWHPGTEALRALRSAIVAKPLRWRRILSARGFRERFHLSGRSLQRTPRGFEPDHPLIEDLKRRDFVLEAPLSEAEVCAPDFSARYAKLCKAASPFMEFLADAVGVRW